MTARRQLVDLLREYEHRLLPGNDDTPRGVAELLRAIVNTQRYSMTRAADENKPHKPLPRA